jgi:hypothetical protein
MINGSIPNSWRKVAITPIYKSGDKHDICNYRPVAVSSSVLRIMERIIAREMCQFLLDGRQLSSSQHGFISGRSIETAGIMFYDYVTKSLDEHLCVDAVYLDFSRAFDTVPHRFLLSKLSRYGICGSLMTWIENYLSNRSQCVRIHGVHSDFEDISSGVIQGSALGPLFFTIFVDDVDESVLSHLVVKYADDIKLAVAFDADEMCQKTSTSILQTTIDNIESWSRRNGLCLNTKKSKSMHFGGKNLRAQYSSNNLDIEQVNTFKDLGITISQRASFSDHISGAVSKANRVLGLMKKSFISRTSLTLLPIYKSNIRSILEFGSIIWSPHTQASSDLIERVQKRFTRIFADIRPLSYRQRLQKLSLLSLATRRLRYRLIFLFKILRHMTSLVPEDYFTYLLSQRGNPYKLRMPISRLKLRSKFFTVDTIRYWNKLTLDEVNVDSVDQFKGKLCDFFSRVDLW